MRFYSCDITSGEILAELPLGFSGQIMRALQTVTTAEFELAILDPRCPHDWHALTDPYRVWLVVVDDNDTVAWAGIPETRVITATSPVVRIGCVSGEGYLARRFVPTKEFKQADQTTGIAAWLVNQARSLGVGIELDIIESGIKRDRTYYRDDNATVLKRLDELSNVINGFEYTIDYFIDQGFLIPVFRTGYPRIGIASDQPQAVFELPGGLVEVTEETRWGESDAATHVLAVGSGEGEDTPFSEPHIAYDLEDAGFPRLELRKSFDSVQTISVLDSHAEKLLSRYAGGTTVYTLKQRMNAYPMLGVDWNMGDDVRVLVNTDSLKLDTTMRIVGWQIEPDFETLSPIVADLPDDEIQDDQ